jgi:hypothetical protein
LGGVRFRRIHSQHTLPSSADAFKRNKGQRQIHLGESLVLDSNINPRMAIGKTFPQTGPISYFEPAVDRVHVKFDRFDADPPAKI